jgi:sugar lactone lactonase YvrE
MAFKVGSGSLQFELVEGWEQIPDGYKHVDVAGVCSDSKGNVYLFCRGDHPVMIYDRNGKFLDSWGEGGEFSYRVHGMYMGDDDSLYLVDDSNHRVAKYSLDGKLAFELGPAEHPSDTGGYDGRTASTVTKAGGPFNRPTNLAVAPGGDLIVSDGYGNTRIHRFDTKGQLCESFGEPGSGPGQFRIPHSTWVHTDGRIFVCDRENDRIQVFSPSGEFQTEWLDVQRPQDIFIDKDERVYVGELVWRAGMTSFRNGPIAEERPARLSIFDINGNVLLRWGSGVGPDAAEPGQFVAPHGIWVDDQGSIYMAEVTDTIGVRPGIVPEGTHTFQKFARI